MKTKETETAIRSELGDQRVHVALIGPAGEKTGPLCLCYARIT